MKVVIDASLGVTAVLDTPLTEVVAAALNAWWLRHVQLYAPTLWLNEVTSAIHKIHQSGAISREIALEALAAALDLDIEWVEENPRMCRAAFGWASRLGQLSAYDAFYLALAEELDAHYWTADERLTKRARQLGLPWVHWVGEASPEK